MDEAFEELIAIVELLNDAEFTQFRYQRGDLLVEVSRGAPLASSAAAAPTPASPAEPQAPAPAPAAPAQPAAASAPAAAPAAEGGLVVEAPMLGTFYRSPKPGEPPFVQVGDQVTPDTVVAIVEVMKLMNSVTAGVSGTVVEVCVADGELVEPGTTLFRVSAD